MDFVTFFSRLVLLGTLACTVTVQAQNIAPIVISNYNPFIAVHGLPQIGSAANLEKGANRVAVMYDLSSYYVNLRRTDESVILDGETQRTTFVYQLGLSERLQVGVFIPYVNHSGGSLDSFINDWHDFFGLPGGGRETAENDQLRFYYEHDGITQFDKTSSSSGIADVRLEAAWQLNKNASKASAMAASIKIPSGDSDEFHGSGAVDIALWYKQQQQERFFGLKGGMYYSVGALYLGNGDILAQQVNSFVAFGGLGAGVYLAQGWLFLTQLDINTPFYDSSEVAPIGEYAVQLTLGGAIDLSKNARLHLGVAEDLVVDASPDVTFHLDLQVQF